MKNLLPISFISFGTLFLLSSSSVFANGEDVHEEVQEVVTHTLEDSLRSTSIKVVVVAAIIILGFVVLTMLLKHFGERMKKMLFAGIVIPTLLATIFMVGSTLYLNFTSSSGGPVHWHADIEVWDCGNKLDFTDPQGFSNKVGTSTFHEHNDGRMHVEGVVTNPEEASLGKFFGFIGGGLTSDEMRVPTNDGLIVRNNGDLCDDGDEGVLQVFVYKTRGNTFSQMKLDDPASYILSPESNVPPGDCIIIEFDEGKEKTNKLCNFYKLKIETGDLKPAPGALEESTNTTPESDTQESTSSAEPAHDHEEGVDSDHHD